MKTVTVHEWNGMRVDLCRMDAGDTIPRHSQPFVHSTGVACGSTQITIWRPNWEFDPGVFTMRSGDDDLAFAANISHEIKALEDGTIIVNMQFHGLQSKKGNDGGIAFDD